MSLTKLAPAYRQLYQNAAPPASIVHLGVGNFFRSHLNFITHLALEKSDDATLLQNNWSIHGLGLLNHSSEIDLHQALHTQSYLYSLLQLPSGTVDVVGALSGLSHTQQQVSGLEESLRYLSQPSTKIISMTVTEKGYHQANDGGLDFNAADIQHDLDKLSRRTVRDVSSLFPLRTPIGTLVAGLALRKHVDVGNGESVTMLCCDNLPHNGNVLKRLIHDMSSAVDSELSEWITQSVSFPNSMVDRITPAADDATKGRVQQVLGKSDAVCRAPVQCEDFYQWVVEDNFVAGRPAWETVEHVVFVDDVTQFENMKLRLLNGSHTALSYISSLLFLYEEEDKYVTVDRVMRDADVERFVREYMNEVKPTLNGGPEGEKKLDDYCDSLVERFNNQDISDQVSRLCQDGSKKFQGFVVPPLSEMMSQGADTRMIQKVVASWYVYLREWKGTVDDPSGLDLLQLAKDGKLKEFLARGIGSVGTNEEWVRGVERQVKRLNDVGPRAFLQQDV